MRRILLPSLLLALAAPAAAGAAVQHVAPVGSSDGAVSPRAALRKAEAGVAGRGIAGGHELTPLLKQLAVALPSLKGAERTRARRLLARPTQGDATPNESAYTMPEHAPLCSSHFCIHWVDSGPDAPPGANPGPTPPQYVQMMDEVFEHVYAVENDQLGWQPPRSDGARGCPANAAGCLDKTDVYLKNIGDQGIYGYAAPDPQQKTIHQAAYLVMDNDYGEQVFTSRYPDGPLRPAEVTAAHEYNHVLQFGYDVIQDTWMFESTAVWMEDKVYTEVNDYLQYLPPWAQLTTLPLTQFNSNSSDDPRNVKVYGDMVWNRWLDAKYGEGIVRSAWEHSLTRKPTSFAPGSYDQALKLKGSSFFNAFTRFAADTAEWRASNTPFPEGSSFPDVSRQPDGGNGSLIHMRTDTGEVRGHLSHTAYALIDVAPTDARRIKLVFDTPRGKRMALALVGRTGDITTGSADVAIKRLPKGGTGTVTLSDPSQYSRITAVIINGDARTTGRFSRTLQDWQWTSDSVRFATRLSTDFKAPRITHRSPSPGARGVSRTGPVKIRFSEPMIGISRSTVVLAGPRGHHARAKVKLLSGGRVAQIRPVGRLRAGTRYRVRIGGTVEDLGGNVLPRSSRSWPFVTGR